MKILDVLAGSIVMTAVLTVIVVSKGLVILLAIPAVILSWAVIRLTKTE